MKKYLIRIVGALCILGATALMFMPAWLELDGVRSRDLRDVREDVTGIVDTLSEQFIYSLDDDDFKDDLKDNKLPYTRSTVKKQFKELGDLSKELLNNTVSLKELVVLGVKAPGLIKDLENVLELEAADGIFVAAADYALNRGNDPMIDATWEDVQVAGQELQDNVEDAMDSAAIISLVCYGLVAALGLIFLLAVASAVTHVCNKGRWLKYLVLVVMILLVAGSMVAMPMVNELLSEALSSTPKLEDLSLKMKLTPIVAVALMFVPIALDIIFEKKNKQIKMEA